MTLSSLAVERRAQMLLHMSFKNKTLVMIRLIDMPRVGLRLRGVALGKSLTERPFVALVRKSFLGFLTCLAVGLRWRGVALEKSLTERPFVALVRKSFLGFLTCLAVGLRWRIPTPEKCLTESCLLG
jgi:hypothetical protein